jgi:hypothetical protein
MQAPLTTQEHLVGSWRFGYRATAEISAPICPCSRRCVRDQALASPGPTVYYVMDTTRLNLIWDLRRRCGQGTLSSVAPLSSMGQGHRRFCAPAPEDLRGQERSLRTRSLGRELLSATRGGLPEAA